MKPLSGVIVLDLTRYLTGPYCTFLLGGLGAEVIKIEAPVGKEKSRERPPYGGLKGAGFVRQTPDDMNLGLLHRARNKKSLTLNLRHQEGMRLFKELCCKADIVVENYAPGVLERMGIDYPVLRDLNPRLILCSISGFGQTGPLREWRAYDGVIQAMSGISSITGYPDQPPVRCGAAISDTTAPLFAVIGLLAALRQREQTGHGEWVDISMLDTSLFHLPEILELFMAGTEPQQRGNDHTVGTPFNNYEASDGYVAVSVVTDSDWENLLTAIGREDLLTDERFATRISRRQHVEAIGTIVGDWIKQRSKAEAGEILQRHRVPAGPVLTLPEVMTNQQIRARQMVVDLDHPTQGSLPGMKGLGMPIRFVERPCEFDQPAPLHGAHNAEVYQRLLGLESEALEALRSKGVI
jgi:crotonobetainyl-CoA:carnitine CoA-transferase CaiB-like acyl-CoA transferase